MSLGSAPFSLSNVTAPDAYSPAATVDKAPEGGFVSISVVGAAIFYRLQRNYTWESFETFLAPWVGSLPRPGVTGIAVRNAVAGAAAQVSANIQDAADSGSVPNYTISPSGAIDQTGGSGLVTGDVVLSAAGARSGAVPADGAHYNSVIDTSFAALFAAIGTNFGGTGPADFAVPDLRDRAAFGVGAAVALAANEGVAYGARGGPSHFHAFGREVVSLTPGGTPFSIVGSGVTVDHFTTGAGTQDKPSFLGLNAFIVK